MKELHTLRTLEYKNSCSARPKPGAMKGQPTKSRGNQCFRDPSVWIRRGLPILDYPQYLPKVLPIDSSSRLWQENPIWISCWLRLIGRRAVLTWWGMRSKRDDLSSFVKSPISASRIQENEGILISAIENEFSIKRCIEIGGLIHLSAESCFHHPMTRLYQG